MKKVSIYSTPTCTYCQMTKEFLANNNIEFTNIDVSTDEEKRNEMIQKSGQMGVPVVAISEDGGNEELVIGFDEARLKSLLGIA